MCRPRNTSLIHTSVLFLALVAMVGMTPPPPRPLPPTPPNSTLLFDSALHGNSLRNCSCASEIQDCSDTLANLLCSCRTVPRSSLPPAGLRMQGGLTVWVHDGWLLRELLNGSTVQDLRLSACGRAALSPPFPPRYLALFGLRSLRVFSSAPGAAHPEQALTISPGPTWDVSGAQVGMPPAPFHVSFLDVSVLNGRSSLKAYSVNSSSAANLTQHFPHLPLPHAPPQHGHPQQACLLTFIY
ncbi:exosomal polycystin-1-interacting protein [Paramormyrops kingsleyae]|uniref:exosomal polycystin-1-interacting protein n=1 Tax=Paramormyrops kingsleyae TaxID=1676925 RepID=UPI003B977B0C